MKKYKYKCTSWSKRNCGGKPCKVKVWVEMSQGTPDSPDACIYKLGSQTEDDEWASWVLIND